MSQSISDQIQMEEERARKLLTDAKEKATASFAKYQTEERSRLDNDYQAAVNASNESKASGDIVAKEAYEKTLKTGDTSSEVSVSDADVKKVAENTEFFISLLS